MNSSTNYNNERQLSTDIEFGADPASGSFFSSDFKRHDDLKQMLDGNKDSLKLEAMKRIISMVAKGKDVSDLFPAVVKNVVSSNLEVKKLVYVYLVRYAEEQQDLALLSISTFQRGLKDPNPLIRACALRVLSSIRVHVIVPIMMLAIKETVMDLSPYVRKTTAHAIPKLFSLDPEQKEELVKVIEKLLSDMSTLVVGSAVMAFEEVCPERIDLIHANYRKLCCMLVDVEEWGQVIIINMLTKYARAQFLDPNQGKSYEESNEEKPFYDEDNSAEADKEDRDAGFKMDPDHRLLLSNTKPLLLSRNAAVVLSVAQLYQHIGPHAEVGQMAKALIRLLRSHREVQVIVLTNIASLSTQRKGMFEPSLKSFFVRSSDPTQIKVLKLEVITNIATEANISLILREFQTYIWSPDRDFVAATIQAIGRCASNIKEVTDTCLSGLVSLLSNKDELVVGESVVVIRKLLQSETVGHKDIITHMARLVDNIKMPSARASILWLFGEYCNKVPKIAPDVLRKMAKSFVNEADMVKLQIMTLATKLYLTNPKQTHLLCQYVLNLAKYDANYDIRDRARFIRALLSFPTAGEKDGNKPPLITGLAKQAQKIFLAPKSTPIQHSTFKDRDHLQLGTLSHMINARAVGYRDLPPFPTEAPDSSVRNLNEMNGLPSRDEKNDYSADKKRQVKKESFYSDDEEDETSGSDDSGSTTSDTDDSGSSSGTECESDSDSDKSKSDSDEEVKSIKKGNKAVNSGVISKNNGTTREDIASSDDASSSESAESDSSSDSDESVEVNKGRSENKSKLEGNKNQRGACRSNLDLLLDLDMPSLSIDTPVLTPSLGGFLSPVSDPSSSVLASIDPSSFQTASPAVIPTATVEILNRIAGNGLSIHARFTRSPHLYSPSMTSVELTFKNNGNETLQNICMGSKRLLGGMAIHEFSPIPSLGPNSTVHATIGIDFKDSISPVHFDILVGDKSFSIAVAPNVGELLQPVSFSEVNFKHYQAKLRGMNEQSGTVTVPSHLRNEKIFKSKIYHNANVLQVPNSDDDQTLRFAGQTSSEKSIVLVTLLQLGEGDRMKVSVHCEKVMFTSMLFKHLSTTVFSS